jgi:hypothetical protein
LRQGVAFRFGESPDATPNRQALDRDTEVTYVHDVTFSGRWGVVPIEFGSFSWFVKTDDFMAATEVPHDADPPEVVRDHVEHDGIPLYAFGDGLPTEGAQPLATIPANQVRFLGLVSHVEHDGWFHVGYREGPKVGQQFWVAALPFRLLADHDVVKLIEDREEDDEPTVSELPREVVSDPDAEFKMVASTLEDLKDFGVDGVAGLLMNADSGSVNFDMVRRVLAGGDQAARLRALAGIFGCREDDFRRAFD